MNFRVNWPLFLLPIVAFLGSCGDNNKNAKEEQTKVDDNQAATEIREKAQQYIDAINNGNLDEIVKFWSNEAVYRNPITGELVRGRKGIKEEMKKIFNKLESAHLDFEIKTIRFPMEGKVTEYGIITLKREGKPPITSEYKMSHVKKKGEWLIFHVSDMDFGVLNQETDTIDQGDQPRP